MGADGKEIKLEAPTGDELPAKGFDPGNSPLLVHPLLHLARLHLPCRSLASCNLSGGVGDDA